jgi:hypothetical protein
MLRVGRVRGAVCTQGKTSSHMKKTPRQQRRPPRRPSSLRPPRRSNPPSRPRSRSPPPRRDRARGRRQAEGHPASRSPPRSTSASATPSSSAATAQASAGTRARLLDCVSSDTWSIVLPGVEKPLAFKFLLNDEAWSAGRRLRRRPRRHGDRHARLLTGAGTSGRDSSRRGAGPAAGGLVAVLELVRLDRLEAHVDPREGLRDVEPVPARQTSTTTRSPFRSSTTRPARLRATMRAPGFIS